jgi:tetratricopeptide (TPR) repeat protein
MAQEKHYLKQYKPDFALFVESGFVAINQCDEQSAIRLLGAAYMLNPEHPAPHLGLGYLYLNMEQLDRAIISLEESLKRDASMDLTKVLLGGALTLAKKDESRAQKLIEEVTNSQDPEARKMAQIWTQIRDRLREKNTRKPAAAL